MDHERAHWGRMDHERADWGGMDKERADWGGMDHEPAPQATDTPYLKLPWLLVAGGLVVLLGAALAVGLLANRSLHEQITLPTPTPASVLAPPPTVVAPPPTAVAPSATSPPPTATPVPQATPTPVATATAQPVLAATPRPTVDPALADEVSAAYLHYWDVRAEAFLNLDDSQLPDVMAGDHLASAEKLIQELRSQRHAIQTNVEHRYAVVSATADSAEVADTYVENSVYVDLQTHSPLTEPSGDTMVEVYVMAKSDGTWRVVSLERAS